MQKQNKSNDFFGKIDGLTAGLDACKSHVSMQ